MARKEAINTFTDGMVSDLNPLNTPNTVLTDCLNGTLITYDGNEFTLQNDKGNYPLKNCKLPENYIPVGVKEYGDILYIVSYNPVDNKVQVGSYPSPQTIYSDITEKTRDFTPINNDDNLSQLVTSIWTNGTRADISNNENLKIFYGGNKPEIYKLNPGDQYRLIQQDVQLTPYEEIEFYVVDDNKKTHKIDSSEIVINKSTSDNDGFSFVKWNVPGYLAVKTRFADIDDFIVNTRKIKIQKYEGAYGNNTNALEKLILNFQAVVSDNLIKSAEHVMDELHVKVHYNGWSSNVDLELKPTGIVKNDNGNWIFYWNWDALAADEDKYKVFANAGAIVQFTIVPEIKLGDNNTVVFEEFKKTITFDLSVKGNVNEFTIGEGTWRWTVDNNLTLRFDTGGIQENAVFDQDLFLRCTISRHTGITNNGHTYNIVKDVNNKILNNVLLEDFGAEWNVQGFTEITLPFVEFPDSESSYLADIDRLYAEDYYQVEFNFYDTTTGDIPIREPIKKNILATKLLNGNTASRYDLLTFEDWFPKYSDFVENKYVILDGNVVYDNPKQITHEIKSEDRSEYDIWMTDLTELPKYPKFSIWPNGNEGNVVNLTERMLTHGFDITATATFPLSLTYSNKVQLPKGPLWRGLIARTYYNETASDSDFNNYTGTDTVEIQDINKTGTYKKSIHYDLKQQNNVGYAIDAYNVEIAHTKQSDNFILDADGRYENDLNVGVDLEPDIITSFDNISHRYEKTDASTTNDTIKDILSKFSAYDVLFLVIKSPKQYKGDNVPEGKKNSVYVATVTMSEKTYYPSYRPSYSVAWPDITYTYTKATETSETESYWAVFRIPLNSGSNPIRTGSNNTVTSKLWFINITGCTNIIDAFDKFVTVCDNVKHLHGGNSVYRGAFFKAVNPIYTESQKIQINVSGKIKFNGWEYNGINMFTSLRNSLDDNGVRLFNVPISSDKVYNDIEDIILLDRTSDIIYKESDAGQDRSLQSLLDELVTDLDLRNTEIELEKQLYESDKISQNPDLAGIDKFTSNDSRYEQYVNILNKSLMCDTMFGLVTEDIQYGNEIYRQYLNLGVNDKDLTI